MSATAKAIFTKSRTLEQIHVHTWRDCLFLRLDLMLCSLERSFDRSPEPQHVELHALRTQRANHGGFARKEYKTPAQIAIASLDDGPLKRKLSELEDRASLAVGEYLLMTSPLFLLAFCFALIGAVIYVVVKLQFNKAVATIRSFVAAELSPSVRAIDCQVEALDAQLRTASPA